MMSQKYEVVRYAALGHTGEADDGEVIARGLTLDEARRLANCGAGSWRPKPGDKHVVVAFNESDDAGCGG